MIYDINKISKVLIFFIFLTQYDVHCTFVHVTTKLTMSNEY